MEEYEGKRKAVVSDLQSSDSAGVNPKVRSLKGSNEGHLFYLDGPMGSKVCGCIIGTGNGIDRFCLSLDKEGKHSCSVEAHSNKPKATSAPTHAWYVTTTMQGRSGGPAAVGDNLLGARRLIRCFGNPSRMEKRPRKSGRIFLIGLAWRRQLAKKTQQD
jgi:hypothetical protein